MPQAALIETLKEDANGELEVEGAEHCHIGLGLWALSIVQQSQRIAPSPTNFPNAKSPLMSSQSPAQQHTHHQADRVPIPYSSTALAPSSFPSRPGSSILMDHHSDSSEGSLTTENHTSHRTGKESTERRRRRVTIDMLPDDVLLETFDFDISVVEEYYNHKHRMEAWLRLVHVCRRWRSVVFGSPRRLDLRLVCSTRTPTDTLDIWPAFPLAIEDEDCQKGGLITLLKRSELVPRITQIYLEDVHLEDISEAMEVPFPELTRLVLCHSFYQTGPVIPLPDSFLGGSVPRLKILFLERIPFPGLPMLLSSATHLTHLYLYDIPHSGYISPEAMVASLSVLTSLKDLKLHFQSPRSRPNRESRRPPPSTRNIIPVLTLFSFKGDSEYLEDLVARVDAPQLKYLYITFFNDIVFDTPQLTRFISNTPMFNAFDEARVILGNTNASIKLSSTVSGDGELKVEISCRELHWQVSALEQVCTSSLSPLFTLEDLYIDDRSYRQPVREDNIDNELWLELLRPFTTVTNLFLSENIAPRVVPALQELVVGRTMEVLPTLRNVFIRGLQPSGPVQEGVAKFVAARQLTSHPIVVSRWD